MDSFNPIDSSFPDSKRDQKYEIAGLFFLCILMCFDGLLASSVCVQSKALRLHRGVRYVSSVPFGPIYLSFRYFLSINISSV